MFIRRKNWWLMTGRPLFPRFFYHIKPEYPCYKGEFGLGVPGFRITFGWDRTERSFKLPIVNSQDLRIIDTLDLAAGLLKVSAGEVGLATAIQLEKLRDNMEKQIRD